LGRKKNKQNKYNFLFDNHSLTMNCECTCLQNAFLRTIFIANEF